MCNPIELARPAQKVYAYKDLLLWAQRMKLSSTRAGLFVALTVWSITLLHGCRSKSAAPQPVIQITRVPQASEAGGAQTDVIEGRVSGASSQDRVVLYAQNKTWWVQPLQKQPSTPLDRRFHWINGTHLGTRYAALLVGPAFVPADNIAELPQVGGPVKAVAVMPGQGLPPSPYIAFSGYQWRVRTAPSNRGGTTNKYAAENVSTDPSGALHMRLTGGPAAWTCAEVTLTQSLGYGTYSLEVRDISKLEPAVVLTFFTYDYAGGDDNRREANVEVSRWGEPANKNGQYVVQPFHVPSNVFRFSVPPGQVVHSLQWEAGRMTFSSATRSRKVFNQHTFLSGVPSPGLESPRIAFYAFHGGQNLTHPAEVIIEKFTYLP
jgi:hypothetical protein